MSKTEKQWNETHKNTKTNWHTEQTMTGKNWGILWYNTKKTLVLETFFISSLCDFKCFFLSGFVLKKKLWQRIKQKMFKKGGGKESRDKDKWEQKHKLEDKYLMLSALKQPKHTQKHTYTHTKVCVQEQLFKASILIQFHLFFF